ncbi:GIN domain-containing protein [Mucilaginibacter gilvus]|uniref:Putative auto-transporter adhesin head GIN domain-containing protein n=1 Tax=Mucilaginibacter gilvus TaxID=2305909 RepID=A0A444MIS2_9SPHI|nr:DUF2807 domain-containing protein [Mucilaginibacter gilvus]RWY48035.1 hypothetical protein EPL05_20840 [Mucilaginibacter gilvus]
MKIKNLFLIATVILALVSFKSTYANTTKDDAFTILQDVGAISSIEVHGNVQLFITDAPADVIKVYNKYYAESALIQNKDGVLRISSYGNEKLVIWVKANDLRSVSLFDNAQINSFGTLSKIEFSVDLHNNAQANLNLNAFKLTLHVSNNAKADINGSAEEFNLNREVEQNVTRNNLAVIHLYENKNIAVAGKQITAL